MSSRLHSVLKSVAKVILRNPWKLIAWIAIVLPIPIEIEVQRRDARFSFFWPKPIVDLPYRGPLQYDEFWSVVGVSVVLAIPVTVLTALILAIKSVKADPSQARDYSGKIWLAVFAFVSSVIALFQIGSAS